MCTLYYHSHWWDKIENFLEKNSPNTLAKLLRENQITPAGICPFTVSPFRNTRKNRDAFKAAIDICSEISCDLLTVCPDFCPVDQRPDDARLLLAEEFAWCAEVAASFSIRLSIEPISRHTLVRGPLEALCVIELAGNPENLGLLIDTFHYTCSCVRSEEIRQIPKKKLYMVHVNDCRPGMREELCDADRLYPAEGRLDLKSFMEDIRAIGYDGYFSVELFNRTYWREPIDEICRRAMAGFEKTLRL